MFGAAHFTSENGRAGFDSHLAKARESAAQALVLEPNLPEGLRVRADIELIFDFDLKWANETLQTALALAPADPGDSDRRG